MTVPILSCHPLITEERVLRMRLAWKRPFDPEIGAYADDDHPLAPLWYAEVGSIEQLVHDAIGETLVSDSARRVMLLQSRPMANPVLARTLDDLRIL
jgi:hypothetical protein